MFGAAGRPSYGLKTVALIAVKPLCLSARPLIFAPAIADATGRTRCAVLRRPVLS